MSKKLIILASFIIIAGAGVLLTHPQAVRGKLREAKLLPQPEGFTELYFKNYQNLYTTPSPYQGKYFTFIIHNLENQDMTYTYDVYLDMDGEKKTLVKANAFVPDKGTKQITESFSTVYASKKFRVEVNLINKNQSIYFLVNE